MTTVINTVTINGPSKAVFDLITTARLWPQWHPATKWEASSNDLTVLTIQRNLKSLADEIASFISNPAEYKKEK